MAYWFINDRFLICINQRVTLSLELGYDTVQYQYLVFSTEIRYDVFTKISYFIAGNGEEQLLPG
jgi:hypothetical protein